MSRTLFAAAAIAALAFGAPSFAADGPPPPRSERVTFAKGATSATIKATIKGYHDTDYVVRATAGQTLAVTLKGTNPQNYFNVLPPDSENVAMHVGQDGRDYTGVLPADGDYRIRVYLMRAAARRNESSNYALTVGIAGKPLPPLAASKDALVPGTPYHATANVDCKPPYATAPASCETGVIRRDTDGTATVVARSDASSVARRILFVQGKPTASDASHPITFTRQGDVTIVKIGDERYDIPDALLTGG